MENLNSLMRKTKAQIIEMLNNIYKKHNLLKEELEQLEEDLNVLKDYNLELISKNDEYSKKIKEQNSEIFELKQINNNLNSYINKYKKIKKENYILYGLLILFILFDIFNHIIMYNCF